MLDRYALGAGPIKAFIRMGRATPKQPACGECSQFHEYVGGFPGLGFCEQKSHQLAVLTFDDGAVCPHFDPGVDS